MARIMPRIVYKSRIREGHRIVTFWYHLRRRRLVTRETWMEKDSTWPDGYAFRTRRMVRHNVLAATFLDLMGEYQKQGILQFIRGVERRLLFGIAARF